VRYETVSRTRMIVLIKSVMTPQHHQAIALAEGEFKAFCFPWQAYMVFIEY
jgi:hypothetical protein